MEKYIIIIKRNNNFDVSPGYYKVTYYCSSGI